MLARLFGHINSSTNFLLFIWAFLLVSADFYGFQHNRLIFETNWGEIHFLPWSGFALTVAVLLVITYTAQWLIHSRYHLLKRHAYFPFFLGLFVVLSASENLNSYLLFFFLVLTLGGWLSVYHGEKLLSRALNTGLLLGIASMVDQRMAFLVPFTYVVYIVFGRFNLRTSLIMVVGFVTVWINALALEFIFTNGTTVWQFFMGVFSPEKTLGLVEINYSFFGVLTCMVVLDLMELPKTIGHASVIKRQSYVLLSVLLGLSAVGLFFYPESAFFLITCLYTTLILFVNFFQYTKKSWIREVIMWVAIGIFAVFQLNLV